MRRLVTLLVCLMAATVGAQQTTPAADSVLARAVQLASTGDSTEARRLLDSVAVAGETPIVRGEAAFQLTLLATSDTARERMLSMLIVDHPFSPRVSDALFSLGMLELERSERDRAITHLSRYLSTTIAPDSNRLTASLALGRLLLERADLPRGCAALLVGRAELPEGAIELRNQFEFSIARCRGVDTTTKLDRKRAADVPARQRTGAFTVQVAAYETKAAADRLAARLRAQDLEARVVGTKKPFRVRVGRYATRADAEEASRRVDAIARSRSIVVVVGPEER